MQKDNKLSCELAGHWGALKRLSPVMGQDRAWEGGVDESVAGRRLASPPFTPEQHPGPQLQLHRGVG